MNRGETSHTPGDFIFRVLAIVSGALILLLMLGMLMLLAYYAWPAIAHFGPAFLVSQDWDPVNKEFGALSSIYGTLASTAIAMLLAAPLGLVTAIFLVEVAPPGVSRVVGGALELLAAIPSIIFGMWGFFVFVPWMAEYVQPGLNQLFGWTPLFSGPKHGLGILTSGIILALMVLPFICAVSRDVLRIVPPVMKESAYGLGATTWEVTSQVSLRYGMLGIAGGMFLGLGRAIGETMAVTFVIGSNHKLSASLFDAGNTIASTLANEFAESERFSLHQSVLIELGLILFVITLVFQVLAQLWLRGLRQAGGAR
ncbi:MAG: phosphate ABC transporter permease subunit PstC [Pirellulales bacterium]|nr:phosphate ABC transporter permease subunit PstC [Pirellulales bacterium]